MEESVRLPNNSGRMSESRNQLLAIFFLQRVEPQPEIFPFRIPICMTFNTWLHKREIPDSDRIAMLIQSAGAGGIPETQLRSGIELPKKLVDDILQALVDARMARVVERDGMRWYFSLL